MSNDQPQLPKQPKIEGAEDLQGAEIEDMRPKDIEYHTVLRIIYSNIEPVQYQMAVNNFEAIMVKDILEWKNKEGRGYEEMVKAQRTDLDMQSDDPNFKAIELSSFKFKLLFQIWREKQPKFLHAKVRSY